MTGRAPYASHERTGWRLGSVVRQGGVGIAGLVIVALTAVAFASYVRPHGHPTKPAAKTELVTVKRPLPDGMSEQDVVKWVPLRQPSGRTELAPWTSVDAQLVKDPTIVESLLKPAEKPPASDWADRRPEETRSPAPDEARDAESARGAGGKPAATLRKDQMEASSPPSQPATR